MTPALEHEVINALRVAHAWMHANCPPECEALFTVHRAVHKLDNTLRGELDRGQLDLLGDA